MSVEAVPPSVQSGAGPVPAGARTPVAEVPNLHGHCCANAVYLTQPRHLAVPLRRQKLAVERDVEAGQLGHRVQEHKPPGAGELPRSGHLDGSGVILDQGWAFILKFEAGCGYFEVPAARRTS
jgi:hypothetical protein